MFTGRLWLTLSIALAPVGCVLRPVEPGAIPLDGGSVWVYVAPLPPGAERLSVEIATLVAVRESGETIPLDLALGGLGGESTSRERLVAWGAAPPGRYVGFDLVLSSATLAGDGGFAELRVSDGPVRVEASFDAARGAAAVVKLSLRFPESVASGFRFDGVFFATPARKLATGLSGLVSSGSGGTVTFFDKATREVTAVVPVGPEPRGIAVDPRRLRAYVAVSGADAVESLDLQEASRIDRLALSGGDRPTEIRLTPDGRRLVAVNSGSNTLSVIDVDSFVEERRVPVGNEPVWVVLDRSGRRAFVANARSNTISVVDLLSDAAPLSVGVESEPVSAVLDRTGGRLYVAHRSSPHLLVLDTGSLGVLERVYVGPGATALGVDRRTDRLYLARRNTGVVEVFDPSSLLPVDLIEVQGEVAHLAVDAEMDSLFLALPGVRGVGVVGLTSKRAAAGLDVGAGPVRLALLGGE